MLARVLRRINDRLGWRVVVWAVLLAVYAGALCTVPLFDLLGYDFAFALGIPAGFAAVDVGHGAVAAARRTGRPRELLPLVAVAVAAALALLVLPLAFALLNAARVQNCNLTAGLAFYLLLPVATALFAAPLGVLAGLLFARGGRTVAFLLPVTSILWSLLRLYFDPAIFVFDPFGGYFPGPIYDEALRPPARLVSYRLVNMIWVATAVAVFALFARGAHDGPVPRAARPSLRPSLRPSPLPVAALGLVVASTALFATRGQLGFHVTKSDVLRTLSRQTRSAHFVLHTDPAESPAELALVMRDLEFRHAQLTAILGAAPSGPITVYRFPSAEVKKQVVGAGHTLFAKPWTREIFIQADPFPARRLRHELAHVFAGAFGDRVFGVSLALRFVGPFPVPRLASGLIEGIAEAADFGDPDGNATLHQESRAMIADGRAPPLAQVVGAGFSTISGARAYTLAGSFSRFLLDRHGAERLRALYGSAGDFVGVYGQSLATLEAQWRAFLETQPLDRAERARAKERFRRPAIFQKVCARELAARAAEARAVMASEPDRAVTLLESVCRDDPNEPTHRLALADALATAGHHDRALALAEEFASDASLTDPLRARAANLAAAIHLTAKRVGPAEAQARTLLSLATEDAEERNAVVKLRALADDDARRTLGRVFFGDAPNRNIDGGLALYLIDQFARRFPDEALGPYLVGRQLAWRDPALALPSLAIACPDGAATHAKPLSPLFVRECRRVIGEAAFLAGDLARSRAAYDWLKENARNAAERMRAEDFLQRIAWEETRPR